MPGTREAALIAEVLRDLQAMPALFEDFCEILEIRRETMLVRSIERSRFGVETARSELRQRLEEEREPPLGVAADAVLPAVARYVDDLHALYGGIPGIAAELEPRGPLGVVGRPCVVVLPVVALESAAHEMRVDYARKAHYGGLRARESVLLQRRRPKVERHVARDKHGIGPGDPVGARQHHELAKP